ncbi:MAG: acylglycerol lipase [Rhodothermales bacterium]
MADQNTEADHPQIYREFWATTTAPIGAVVVAHGYAEHCGRYAHLARALNDAGFAALLYDHRGFGQSAGPPGFVGAIDDLADDLGEMVITARDQWPGIPLFVFGHSMGGLVSTLYSMREESSTTAASGTRSLLSPPPGIDGLILSSPLLRSQEAPVLQKVATLLGTLAPRLPTITMDRSAISRIESVVDDANADPLNYHGRMPAGTGAAFIRGMRRVDAEGHLLSLPVLIFHGTADRLADPNGSRDLYDRLTTSHKQLSLFEGVYHEALNDLNQDRVLSGIVEWLEDCVAD